MVFSRSFVLVGEALSVDPESRFYTGGTLQLYDGGPGLDYMSWSTTSTDAYTKTPTILHNVLIIRNKSYQMHRSSLHSLPTPSSTRSDTLATLVPSKILLQEDLLLSMQKQFLLLALWNKVNAGKKTVNDDRGKFEF